MKRYVRYLTQWMSIVQYSVAYDSLNFDNSKNIIIIIIISRCLFMKKSYFVHSLIHTTSCVLFCDHAECPQMTCCDFDWFESHLNLIRVRKLKRKLKITRWGKNTTTTSSTTLLLYCSIASNSFICSTRESRDSSTVLSL